MAPHCSSHVLIMLSLYEPITFTCCQSPNDALIATSTSTIESHSSHLPRVLPTSIRSTKRAVYLYALLQSTSNSIFPRVLCAVGASNRFNLYPTSILSFRRMCAVGASNHYNLYPTCVYCQSH